MIQVVVTYWMTNSADPDQAIWSVSTRFAKAGHIQDQQDQGWEGEIKSLED